MSEFKTYTFKTLKGTLGDIETERWTAEDWAEWNKYIEEIKADGTYLQPVTVNITLKPSPLFDGPVQTELPLESSRFEMLDLSSLKPKS